MKNLKNKSMVLSVALAAVLSFGMTGCGSDDVADALTNGAASDIINGNGGTVTDLTSFGYIVIFNNVSQEEIDMQLAGTENLKDFKSSVLDSSASCSDYGFSASDKDSSSSYTDGDEQYISYIKYNPLRGCEENDFNSNSYYSGSKTLVISYNM